MTSLIRRFALVICILAIAGQASAQVVLLSQSRSVYGNAEAWGVWWQEASDSDSLAAPDFGLFEEEINLEAFSWGDGGDPGAWSRVSATQDSEIQTSHFSIHGSSTAADIGSYGGYTAGFGSAHSDFEVLFEVLTSTPFSLVGTLAASDFSMSGSNIASLQLDRDGAPYLFFNIDFDGEIAVDEGGILESGAYIMTVNASSMASTLDGGHGSSSFDIDFFLEMPVAVDQMAWGQVKALFR